MKRIDAKNERIAIERKALLADSGEALLSAEDLRMTASWRRDTAVLANAVRDSAAPTALDADFTARDLWPSTRAAITGRGRLVRRRRAVRRLAAAALATVMAGGAVHLHSLRAEQSRLERLGSVLFLLQDPETAAYGDLVPPKGLTLELLADMLYSPYKADAGL